MIKYRIHMEFSSLLGSPETDYVDIEGETIGEIKSKANDEIERRNPDHFWSESVGYNTRGTQQIF